MQQYDSAPYYPYPYSQPYMPYFPPKSTNWAAIIAGLAALGVGSYAVYWLWEHGYFGGGCKVDGDCPTGTVCKDGKCVPDAGCTDDGDCQQYYHCVNGTCVPMVQCTSDTDCPPNYKCSNNTCVPNIIPCSNLNFTCSEGFNGHQLCDINKNLCRCNGSQWSLVEENSDICRNKITHNACFSNPYLATPGRRIAQCTETWGAGVDECIEPQVGFSVPCPCGGVVDCDVNSSCCDDGICRKRATNSLLYTTVDDGSLNRWNVGDDQYAAYYFDSGGVTGHREPVYFNKLIDPVVYTDGSYYGLAHVQIFRGYNYGGWIELTHQTPWNNGEWEFNLSSVTLNPPACMDCLLIVTGAGSPISKFECKVGLG